MEAAACLARDNGFKIIIILSGHVTNLADQTKNRVYKSLDMYGWDRIDLQSGNKPDYQMTNNKIRSIISTQGSVLLDEEDKPALLIVGMGHWLTIEKIANQDSKNLPKTITIPKVYHFAEGYVMPQSLTPTVCVGIGFYAKIVGGGTCTLSYQVAGSSTYLASDIYKVTFEVIRDLQTITFTPSATANISSKSITLSAVASGGGVITYATTSTEICSITGSTLNLLKSGNCSITATQAGTSTLAPISATSTVMITGSLTPINKTITCVMGKKSKKVSGVNPKCPKGYKLKK
jgi:hypothetical protein